MRILCIGHATYDITNPVKEYPIENKKYKVEGLVECGGGSAANASYLLGSWGSEVVFAGVIGYDVFGNRIKKELENAHVILKYLQTNYEHDTSYSFNIVNEVTGTRTLFDCTKEPVSMTNPDFTEIEPELIYVDDYDYPTAKYALTKFPNAIKIIDASNYCDNTVDLCKLCNYVVTSKNFAEKLSNTFIDYNNPQTLATVYMALKKKFSSSEIVVTLEEKGAMYSVNNQIKVMPAYPLKAVDTTAAGDIFHAAFAYGLSTNSSLEKCVKYGNIAAGMSVAKIGGRNSIPSLTDVEANMAK